MKAYQLILPLAAIMALSAENADAQFLDRLKDKAVNTAKDNIENRVGNATNKAIDNALDGDHGKKNKKDKNNQSKEDYSDNQDEPQNNNNTPAPKKQDKKALEMEYAKSDFVPGDEVFFFDDFEREQLGEFASQWDLISGSAEMAMINGKKAFFLTEESTEIEPLMTNQSSYLPDVFTLEFDFMVGDGSEIDSDQRLFRCHYTINFKNEEGTNIGDIEIKPSEEDKIGSVDWNIDKPTEGFLSGAGQISNTTAREFSHLAVSFNKRAMKVYINGVRVANLPNVKAPNRFSIERSGWWDHKGNYIKNVKICKGAVPLYDRLASEGKIISYGITFESGKADLKPESMTEIARIAKLMQEKPELKFEVQGHCDNQGSDAVNDPLSQKRAEAIVAALVKQGIAANRLTAVGKGSHTPIADNSTDEGRAKNRRVEFVKK